MERPHLLTNRAQYLRYLDVLLCYITILLYLPQILTMERVAPRTFFNSHYCMYVLLYVFHVIFPGFFADPDHGVGGGCETA